jgi:NADH-quinone oxidoreductase subunit L
MYARFFAMSSLFAFAMLALVVTDNLLVLYMAWEIMGLCSYLLIGFWYGKPSARDALLRHHGHAYGEVHYAWACRVGMH